MKHKISIFGSFIFLLVIMSTAHATRIEEKIITLQSNERFNLIQARKVKFLKMPVSLRLPEGLPH